MLAIAFELGAAASLASIVILDKINKFVVWSLFIVLTAMQMMGNMFNSYIHLEEYVAWVELFGLNTLDVLSQKRIIAAVSGAILPVVALGFIKSLIDYIKPTKENDINDYEPFIQQEELDPEFNQIVNDNFNDLLADDGSGEDNEVKITKDDMEKMRSEIPEGNITRSFIEREYENQQNEKKAVKDDTSVEKNDYLYNNDTLADSYRWENPEFYTDVRDKNKK